MRPYPRRSVVPARIYYKLTALGQATLKAESDRLSAVAAIARRQFVGDPSN